ncbi:phage tail assembly protein [Roseospira goensis]|uniref:Phage tail assembly protein n=1 Tax=Roseospira goensis TaxID=391922 RepID=A0A7W6WML9_9PROT|nr:phage tail assembly protein [Roseospira goensis]MBB4287642.1 hypothetical protein [Roseospira goensis]
MAETKTDTAAPDDDTRTVALPRPVEVAGMGRITELRLREPVARDLYGVSLLDLANSQVGALMAIGARVHTPRLPPDVWGALDLANTLAITGVVGGFFADAAGTMGLDLDALTAGAESPSSRSRT